MVPTKKKETNQNKNLNKKFVLISLILFLLIPFTLAQIQTRGTFSIQPENYCGDSAIGGNEECDLTNLNEQTCITRGYDAGDLICTEDCMFNESLCRIITPKPESSGGGGGGERITGSVSKIECDDKMDNDNDGLIDYPDDPGCTNKLDGSEEGKACYPFWDCNEWGECIENIQERFCIDIYYCKPPFKKIESQQCFTLIPELKKCKILGFACWLWPLTILILIISVIYYYKKKQKAKSKQKRRSKKTK